MKELGVHWLTTGWRDGQRYASFFTFEVSRPDEMTPIELPVEKVCDDRVVVQIPLETKDPLLAKYAGETVALFNIWRRL